MAKTREHTLEGWTKAFHAALTNDPERHRSFRILQTAGLTELHIVQPLFYYTSLASGQRTKLSRQFTKEILANARTISKAIESAKVHLWLDDEDLYNMPVGWPRDLHGIVVDELGQLEADLAILQTELKPFASEKGANRDEEVLIELCELVKAVTNDPHWRDIAEMLRTAAEAAMSREEWDEEKLRKLHRRFVNANAYAFKLIKERAIAAAAGIQATGPTEKRSTKNLRLKKPKKTPVSHFRSYLPK